MPDLYIDIYFRGMVKMVLNEYDLSFFRGINRVAHEYARRLPEQPGFKNIILFGSRLPSLTQGSFRVAGIRKNLHGPTHVSCREKFLSAANRMDRLLQKAIPRYRKVTRLAGAAARKIGAIGLSNDLYLPEGPKAGDIWLSVCSPFSSSIRKLAAKRVLICYDFNQVYHHRELGLVAPLIAPEFHPGIDVQNDEWVICISEYTRSCFLKFHPGFPQEQVFVVPLGADIAVSNPEIRSEDVLKTYGLTAERYFLTLAAGGPHKNSICIIEEFLKWNSEVSGGGDVKLVLVGSGQNYLVPLLSPAAHAAIKQGTILFTGYAPDEHLPALYENCLAFVFASLAEGFGLPPLEAMLHGAAVICSNKTSLPEVVGDAGLLFDPLNFGHLAECLNIVSTDSIFRHSLQSRGRSRAAEFTWRKSAERLMDVLTTIANTPLNPLNAASPD
jgi:glycosyltransferase involved in cell wall biosynthesis